MWKCNCVNGFTITNYQFKFGCLEENELYGVIYQILLVNVTLSVIKLIRFVSVGNSLKLLLYGIEFVEGNFNHPHVNSGYSISIHEVI